MRRWLFALLCFGCSNPEQPEPQPFELEVELQASALIDTPDALRAAIVWVLDDPDEILVMEDIELTAPLAPFEVTLRMPSKTRVRRARPIDRLRLVEDKEFDSYRPRFVVYEDADRSGDLSVDLSQWMGADAAASSVVSDPIYAIDGTDPSISALLDVERALERLNLEETQEYYDFTDGLYTPFLATFNAGYFRPTPFDGVHEIWVRPPLVNLTNLVCKRQSRLDLQYGPVFGTSRVRVTYADGLDRDRICGLETSDCEPAALAELQPPEFESNWDENIHRRAQCRDIGDLQYLVVFEAELSCERCDCNVRHQLELTVAELADLPAWWPCGKQVEVCESDLPVTAFDAFCLGPASADGGAPLTDTR